MGSSEKEQEQAVKQKAFEGLVEAVQQKDVLFVLYHLKQLDASSINRKDPSSQLTPLRIALSLPPNCPRRALITQLLLFSGAVVSRSKGEAQKRLVDGKLTADAFATAAGEVGTVEASNALLLLHQLSMEEAERWIVDHDLGVEEACVGSAEEPSSSVVTAEEAPTLEGCAQPPPQDSSSSPVDPADHSLAAKSRSLPSQQSGRHSPVDESRILASASTLKLPPPSPRCSHGGSRTWPGSEPPSRTARRALARPRSLAASYQDLALDAQETLSSASFSVIGNVSPPPSRLAPQPSPSTFSSSPARQPRGIAEQGSDWSYLSPPLGGIGGGLLQWTELDQPPHLAREEWRASRHALSRPRTPYHRARSSHFSDPYADPPYRSSSSHYTHPTSRKKRPRSPSPRRHKKSKTSKSTGRSRSSRGGARTRDDGLSSSGRDLEGSEEGEIWEERVDGCATFDETRQEGDGGPDADEEEPELSVTVCFRDAPPGETGLTRIAKTSSSPLASTVSPPASPPPTAPTSGENRRWIQSLDDEDLASVRRMWEAANRRGGKTTQGR